MQYLRICLILVAFYSKIKYSQTALFFPSNSAYGIFAAIAVPLDLPHRNVFVSYNFEANYNLPEKWNLPPYAVFAAIAVPLDLPHRDVFVSYNFEANYNLPETWDIPPYAIGVEDEDLFENEARFHNDNDCNNCTSSAEDIEEVNEEEEAEEANTMNPYKNETDTNSNRRKGRRRRRREIPSLLTRKHFYHILIDKFERSGFEGEPCLLRLICETNASELGEINGVLGNLIHIMFSPTTSKNENLSLAYYQAEIDGIHDQCHHYEEECSESILDLISAPIHEFIEEMQENINKMGK